MKILVCTWNVGNKMPLPSELQHWLPASGGEYDLIAVGTQENAFASENTRQSLENTFDKQEEESLREVRNSQHPGRDSTDTDVLQASTTLSTSSGEELTTAHAWDRMCAERLGSRWVVVAHEVLRQMRLTVYATKELEATSVRNVTTARVATGVAGVVGNKGGLIARMSIGHTTLAFCSSHLAAHEGASPQQARNAMGRRILAKTLGSLGRRSSTRGSLSATSLLGSKEDPAVRQLDAAHSVDHIIWLGDLNYRVDLGLLAQETAAQPFDHAKHVSAVCEMVAAADWDGLLAADQLRSAQQAGQAFVHYREGQIAFAPTFKVERRCGTHYQAQRTPSYTDRILWKSMPPCTELLTQTCLASLPDVSTSDHKPVVVRNSRHPSAST